MKLKEEKILQDCNTCKFPSATKQLANVSLSLFNVVTQAIKTGEVRAANDVVENRIKACLECPSLKEARCLECGCFISLKAGLKSEACPKGKW